MDAAASTIAVVELAAKVGSLCLEYSSAVKNAKPDIERLRRHTGGLKATLEGAQQLLQRPGGARLEYSQKLRNTLDNTRVQLDSLHTKLEGRLNKGGAARAMRRVGLRALKWPFESKDVDKIIANLQRDQDSFTAALSLDQAYAVAPLISQRLTANN